MKPQNIKPISTLPEQSAPANFQLDCFRLEKSIAKPKAELWHWLNKMETFSEGQTYPYCVEFLSSAPGEKPSFTPGTLTNHYGPLLNVAGIIGDMRPNNYRDLQYFYGSYVFFFGLVRPKRLQFWLKDTDNEDSTQLVVQLDVWLKPWFARIWNLGQSFFWKRFMRWAEKSA